MQQIIRQGHAPDRLLVFIETKFACDFLRFGLAYGHILSNSNRKHPQTA
jgi:hypothetical protein